MMESLVINQNKLFSYCKKNNVLALYLFGSQLNGNNDEYSDLDLGVLFYPELKNDINEIKYRIKFRDNIQQFFKIKDIDLVFLQQTGLKMAFKIVTDGKVIYSADKEKRLDSEDLIICKGLDFKEELSLYYSEMEEHILGGS